MTVVIDGTLGVDTIQNGIVTPAKTQVGALPSMVRVNTAAGYGSTNNSVRRYTNTVTNQGTDITYTASAVNGDSFTINTNGTYSVSASDNWTTANTMAITQNAPNLAGVTISAQSPVNILIAAAGAAASFTGNCSWTGYLPAGTVVRLLVDGSGAAGAGTAAPAQFTIQRVA